MPAIGLQAFGKPLAPKIERIPIPECGPDAYACVKALSARDLIELRAAHGSEVASDNITLSYDLLARVICDDAGEPVFADAAAAQAGIALSFTALNELTEHAMRVGGLSVTEKN